LDTKKKILIVDDEETIAWGISKTLSQSDLGVETAYTCKAKEALELIQKTKYDLIITDIRMPEMSGIDLLKEVKEKYPDTGVVIMTAYGSAEVQQEASKRGSIFYIEKPFDIKVLKKVISDFFTKQSNPMIEEKADESESSFTGDVGSLQLMDVVQMNCLGRITCTLKVAEGNRNGQIVFKKGDIVHAETGGMVGKEAFFSIAGWKGGSFEMLDEITAQVTILDHWEQLLIEALQVVDGGNDDQIEGEEDGFDFDFGQTPSGQVKTSSDEPVPSAPVSPIVTGSDLTINTDTPSNDTATLLERIIKDTSAEAVFIMTPDGFVIDRRIINTQLSIEQSGENIAKTLTAILALSENMSAGSVNRIFMTFKDKNMVVKAIPNSDLLFALSIPATKNMDSILPLIEKEAQNLSNII